MVASHFDASGRGGNMMGRYAFESLMLGVTIGVPFLVFVVMAVAPSLAPTMLNIPNAAAWMAGPHTAEARSSLAARGAVMATLLAVFLTAVHVMVVAANQQTPPHLDNAQFITALVLFLLCMGAWTISLMAYFRRGPQGH
jgi:hypothetical protein